MAMCKGFGADAQIVTVDTYLSPVLTPRKSEYKPGDRAVASCADDTLTLNLKGTETTLECQVSGKWNAVREPKCIAPATTESPVTTDATEGLTDDQITIIAATASVGLIILLILVCLIIAVVITNRRIRRKQKQAGQLSTTVNSRFDYSAYGVDDKYRNNPYNYGKPTELGLTPIVLPPPYPVSADPRGRRSPDISDRGGRVHRSYPDEFDNRGYDREEGHGYDKSRDYDRSRDYERSRDYDRSREHDRSHEHDRAREHDRSREHDRPHDYHRSPAYDRSHDDERIHDRADRMDRHDRDHHRDQFDDRREKVRDVPRLHAEYRVQRDFPQDINSVDRKDSRRQRQYRNNKRRHSIDVSEYPGDLISPFGNAASYDADSRLWRPFDRPYESPRNNFRPISPVTRQLTRNRSRTPPRMRRPRSVSPRFQHRSPHRSPHRQPQRSPERKRNARSPGQRYGRRESPPSYSDSSANHQRGYNTDPMPRY